MYVCVHVYVCAYVRTCVCMLKLFSSRHEDSRSLIGVVDGERAWLWIQSSPLTCQAPPVLKLTHAKHQRTHLEAIYSKPHPRLHIYIYTHTHMCLRIYVYIDISLYVCIL